MNVQAVEQIGCLILLVVAARCIWRLRDRQHPSMNFCISFFMIACGAAGWMIWRLWEMVK